MAIYHFSMQVIKRSEGRSCVNASAYRSGEKIKDERLNKTFNYTKKEVHDSFIMKPKEAPDWVEDRAKLWNGIEEIEKRKDAQLAREINVALPVELTDDQQKELLVQYVQKNFIDQGMIADVAIHKDNGENPHAHVMLTMREISPNGFGKKNREWNNKQLVEDWRKDWADCANKYLKENGVSELIDHRSHKERGLETLPQIHEGAPARAMNKRGLESDRVAINQEIKEINHSIVSLQEEIHQTKQAILVAFSEQDPAEKTITKKVLDLKSLRENRSNVEEAMSEIESKIQETSNIFKELKELPKTIQKSEEELAELKSKGLIFKVFNRKEYNESKNQILEQIEQNKERLNHLEQSYDIVDLQKQTKENFDRKEALQKQHSKIKEQILQSSLDLGKASKKEKSLLTENAKEDLEF